MRGLMVLPYRRLGAVGGITIFMLALASPAFAQQISLRIQDIATPAVRASGISADLEKERFTATIEQLSFRGHHWKNLTLSCPRLVLGHDTITCDQGTLKGKQNWPVRFSIAPNAKRLVLDLSLPAEENWHVDAHWGKGWDIAARIENGKAAHFKTWLPQEIPAPSGGTISGRLRLSGVDARIGKAEADFQLAGLAFSDVSGRHAGENISGKIRLKARSMNQDLVWESEALWDRGEIYWDPFYLAGGARLSARGRLDPRQITLEQGSLLWPSIGEISAGGTWDKSSHALTAARIEGTQLSLDALHRTFALPLLGKTALAKSAASGKISFSAHFTDGKIRSLDLALAQASLHDQEGRFALRGVQLALPWRASTPTMADLAIESGQVLALPIGGFKTNIHLQDKNISLPRLGIPILGGRLNIENFQAALATGGWSWEFEGGLTPVSMEQLSAALHWPKMHGTLAGVVPRVRYESGRLALDGALLVNAFDGTAVIQDLVLLDALGRAPRLQARLDMRNLDLGLLTRAFSFGSMQGRVDVAVKGLELSNWKPVAFDAAVRSSPGDYARRISQRAVQNISALGGAGAAAAIQRSFLGVFEEFGYRQLGLSCVLKNGVCLMDGVAAAPNGYVIVQGGGIPAITVIGYNRNVGWDELITRLQRVTQGNKPVVK